MKQEAEQEPSRCRLEARRGADAVIIALLPAHNEASSIEKAIASVQNQTLPPDEILVVCDNCTDDTAALAAASGARITATVSNMAKKAGALNQALAR